MKTFKFILVVLMMVVFASCTKEDFAEVSVKGSIISNGGGQTDPTDPTYKVRSQHKSWAVSGQEVLDYEEAILAKDDNDVEKIEYVITNMVNVPQREISLKVAERLQKQTTDTVKVTITRKPCAPVTFQETSSTYCLKSAPIEGAVAVLGCCEVKPVSVSFGAIYGDRLPVLVTVNADGEQSVSVEDWIVVDDRTKGYDIDDEATVTSPNESSLNVYPTIDGERTGEVIVVKGDFTGKLKAGFQIEKTSKGAIHLDNTVATMSAADANFSYTLDGVSFSDVWAWSATSEALFKLPDGSSVVRPIKADYSVKSTNFSSNNGIYSNAASLYAGNIVIASDVQKIKVITPREHTYPGYEVDAEYAKYAAETDVYTADGSKIAYTVVSFIIKNMTTGQRVFKSIDKATGAELISTEVSEAPMSYGNRWLSLCYKNGKFNAGTLYGVTDVNKVPTTNAWTYYMWNSNTSNQPMSPITVVNNALRGPLRAKGSFNDATKVLTIGTVEIY